MKQLYKILSISIVMLASAAKAEAQDYLKYEAAFEGTSFAKDSVDSIADPLIYEYLGSYIDSDYLVKDVVSLEIKDNEGFVFPDSFRCTVEVAIMSYDIHNSLTTTYKFLTVSYNARNLVKDTLRASFQFYNQYKVKDSIMSITPVGTIDTAVFRLSSSIEIQRQYDPYYCQQAPVFVCDTQYLPDQDELLVTWATSSPDTSNWFYDGFDFEWTFYDDSSSLMKKFIYSPHSCPYDDSVFQNNATRVEITAPEYQIPLIYEYGYIMYRVRPVKTLSSGQRLTGAWTSEVFSGNTGFMYHISGHEDSLNWQAKTSYAEEGKRKSVVTYFDGASKNRQAVTKITTDTISIAAETIYDDEGRPIVNTLPAPTFQKMIAYFNRFNVNYAGQPYSWMDADSDYYCYPTPGIMNSVSGASKYYSPNNPRAAIGYNQFIPDASDYPFSQQIYTNDLTGRIKYSAGPGLYHHMGTNHVTQYLYGAPDQPELDSLFGNEVGDYSHYFKNATIDPNGQVTITYTDMHGRTIATALSGTPQYASMDTLREYRVDTITAALIDTSDNNATNIDGTSIISSKTFMTVTYPADSIYFKYCLFPKSFSMAGCDSSQLCFGCVYNVTIQITDDCSNLKMPGDTAFVRQYMDTMGNGLSYYMDTVCGTNPPPVIDSFYLNLPPGSYTVSKTLTINQQAISYYYNYYIERDTCLKTFNDFYSTALSQINTSGCNTTCATCEAALGDSANFVSRYIASILSQDSLVPLNAQDTLSAVAAYNQLSTVCAMLCDSFDICDQRKILMLSDMSPTGGALGGQYATYTVDFQGGDNASIFSSSATAFTPRGGSPPPRPLYTDTAIHYLNVYGQRDFVLIDTNNDGIPDTLLPNNLSIQQFVEYWNPTWANALLPYHPEYCSYQFCIANSASNDYDNFMTSTATYDSAVHYGLLNPLQDTACPFGASSVTPDPFFASGGMGSTFATAMKQEMDLFYDTTGTNSPVSTIWQVIGDMDSCTSCAASCLNCIKDYYWLNFQAAYQGMKQNFVYTADSLYISNSANCNMPVPDFNSGLFAGKTSRFERPADSLWANADQSNVSTLMDSANAAYAQQSANAFTCQDYATYWWNILSGCHMPVEDSTLVINELVAVCNLGTDPGHPYGAASTSSASVTTANGNWTFDYVLHWVDSMSNVTGNPLGYSPAPVPWTYSSSDSCTTLLITNPLPYLDTIWYYETDAITKPDTCTCGKITDYYNLYVASGDSTTMNFATYLYNNFNIITDSSDMSILVRSCTGADTCHILPHPVTIPYQFSCQDKCVTCAQIDSAYNQFIVAFPNITQSPNYASLLQSWMNTHLGFNITAQEYLTFMNDSCGYNVYPVDTTPPSSQNCSPVSSANTSVTALMGCATMVPVPVDTVCPGGCNLSLIRYGNAIVTVNGAQINYLPAANDTTTNDTVAYQICKACGACDTAYIFVTLSNSTCNNPPVANTQYYYICSGDSQTFLPLQGDYDPDNNQFALTGFLNDSASRVAQHDNYNSFIYTAPVLAAGDTVTYVDTFSYIICDNGSPVKCDTGIIYMNVNNCSGEVGSESIHRAMSVRRPSVTAKRLPGSQLQARAGKVGSTWPFLPGGRAYAAIEAPKINLPKGINYGRLFSLNRNVSARYTSSNRKPWPAHTLFGVPVSVTDMKLPPYVRSKTFGGLKAKNAIQFSKEPFWQQFYQRVHRGILDSVQGNSASDLMLAKAVSGKPFGGTDTSRQAVIRYFESRKDVRARAIAEMLQGPAPASKSAFKGKKQQDKLAAAYAAGIKAEQNTAAAKLKFNTLRQRAMQIAMEANTLHGQKPELGKTGGILPGSLQRGLPGILRQSNGALTVAEAFAQMHPGVTYSRVGGHAGHHREMLEPLLSWCDSLSNVLQAYDTTDFVPGTSSMADLLGFLYDSLGVSQSFPWWQLQFDSCSLACPSIINCTTVQTDMTAFETNYPALTTECNPAIWTGYMNGLGIIDNNMSLVNYSTAEWEAVMNCCSVTYPVADTLNNFCDSINSVIPMCKLNGVGTMECLSGNLSAYIGGGYADSLTATNSITFWLRQMSNCGISCSGILPCSTFDSLMTVFKTSNPSLADSCPVSIWVNYMNSSVGSIPPPFFGPPAISYGNNDWTAMLNCCGTSCPANFTFCDSVAFVVSQYDSTVASDGQSLYTFENDMDNLFGYGYDDSSWTWHAYPESRAFSIFDSCHTTCPNIVNCSYADSLFTAFTSQNPEFDGNIPDFLWAGYLNTNGAGSLNDGGHFYYTAAQWRFLLHCCGATLPAADSVSTFCDSLNDVVTYYNYWAAQDPNDNQNIWAFEGAIGSFMGWSYQADNGNTYTAEDDSFWLAQVAACHLTCPNIINCHLADSLMAVLDSVTNDSCPAWIWVDYLNSSPIDDYGPAYDSLQYTEFLACCGATIPVSGTLPVTHCDTMAIANLLLQNYAAQISGALGTTCAPGWLWDGLFIPSDNFLAPLGPLSALCPQLSGCGYSCVDTCVLDNYCDSLSNFNTVMNVLTANASDGQADTMVVNAYDYVFNSTFDFSQIVLQASSCGIINLCTEFGQADTVLAPVFAQFDSTCMDPLEFATALNLATGFGFNYTDWIHIADTCGFPTPPICIDTLHNLCDSVNAANQLYQAVNTAFGGVGPDVLGKTLSLILGYTVTTTYADSMASACGNSCAGISAYSDSINSYLNPDTCYPAWLYTVLWSYEIVLPPHYVPLLPELAPTPLTYHVICDTLVHCGLTCNDTCGGLGGSHCDTVETLYTLYENIVSANPSSDSFSYAKFLLKNVMGIHISNEVSAYDTLLAMYDACTNTVTCSSLAGVLPLIDSLMSYYTNGLPAAAFTSMLNVQLGVNLSTAEWIAEFNACGDSYHVDTTAAGNLCDSIDIAYGVDTLILAQWSGELTDDSILKWVFNTILGASYTATQIQGLEIQCIPDAICLNVFEMENVMENYFVNTYGSVPYSITAEMDTAADQYMDSVYNVSGVNWCDSFAICGGKNCPMVQPATRYLCNRPLYPPVTPFSDDSCLQAMQQYAYQNASQEYQDYVQTMYDSFVNGYTEKCLEAWRYEHMLYKHHESEFHYTLYYYDQAGNLVQTNPPDGVTPGSLVHTYATKYRYNTTNQVVEQLTPDAGTSYFWYDRILKLTFSQNAKQAALNQLSYTTYDPIQRITEVGRFDGFTGAAGAYYIFDTVGQDINWYAHFLHTGLIPKEVTHTYYDDDQLGVARRFGSTGMDNLRNRVASVIYTDTLHTDSTKYNAATHYSYDVDGNVQTLLQENQKLRPIHQDFKRLDYQYDLISGKVNAVMYQRGRPDAFYHVYNYDADNRLTDVYTSRDSTFFDHDAYYEYYLHGPLARAVIGDKQIQGVDYAYTIQGWLKAINGDKMNGPSLMGQDGYPGRQNALVALDYYGFSLGYFTGDYSPIGTALGGNGNPVAVDTPMESWDLYNGNISRMKEFNYGLLNHPFTDATTPDTGIAFRYRYDQLNRLVGMNAYNYQYNAADSAATFTGMPDYAEHVSYDPNGNILNYFRNGTTANGGPLAMDSLCYKYQPGNNKLDHVHDAVPASNYSVDIDNEDTLNYRYDQIGNLTKDTSAGIDSIYWTVYGKIQRIVKYDGDTIKFHYDPMGNRIAKEVFVDSLHRWTNTYYVHDAQGNIMSTYQWINRDTFNLDELVMYGSSRLGTIGLNQYLTDTITRDSAWCSTHTVYTDPFADSVSYGIAGLKQYEFTNHLGNVLLTLTDRHIPLYIFDGFALYLPEVASAQDYYPFGMVMPGREYRNTAFRFGFNNKEKDDEVYGNGNEYNYGMRIYDSRLGRFLSVDPLTKKYAWYSPFQFSGNCVISCVDIDGLEMYFAADGTFLGQSKKGGTEIRVATKYKTYTDAQNKQGYIISASKSIDQFNLATAGKVYKTIYDREVKGDAKAVQAENANPNEGGSTSNKVISMNVANGYNNELMNNDYYNAAATETHEDFHVKGKSADAFTHFDIEFSVVTSNLYKKTTPNYKLYAKELLTEYLHAEAYTLGNMTAEFRQTGKGSVESLKYYTAKYNNDIVKFNKLFNGNKKTPATK